MKPFIMNAKRAVFVDVTDYTDNPAYRMDLNEAAVLERLDVVYRALVALLYNYVPSSGHPGGSISSGRMVSHLLYKSMLYDFSHPQEPSTPFVRTSTGASGVGLASAVGLALAAADAYAEHAPWVHIIEGEGGLTAGRVSEALAMASTAQLKNAIFHIDWNQASIESERVTAENNQPGEYVQWTPTELFYMHDCNVIYVPNGHDFGQIHAAQKLALHVNNHQPTAIIYRTVKGWKYGLEGKASHGSGHKFCSEEFYQSLAEFEKTFNEKFPRFEGEKTPEKIEKYYWDSLLVIRRVLESDAQIRQFVVAQLQFNSSHLQLNCKRLNVLYARH